MTTHYPKLRTLMAGYFHQDWLTFHRDWRDAIDEFCHENPPDVIQETARQVATLISVASKTGIETEHALATILFVELGGSFDPRPSVNTLTDWLNEIVTILENSR